MVCLPRTPAAAVRLPDRAAGLRLLTGLDLGFRTPEVLVDGTGQELPFLVLSRIPGRCPSRVIGWDELADA